MKTCRGNQRRGFTLIELLVVILIMGIMMTMASSVLRNPGKGHSVESAVDQLESMVHEAQALAKGNDTYTRLAIVNDPRDDARHLRYLVIQVFRKHDSTEVDSKGDWESISSGELLPAGVFFSPTLSRPLDASGDETMLGQTLMRLSRQGQSRVIYAEFDEKGHFVHPDAQPGEETKPQRLVVIPGRRGEGRNSIDGVLTSEEDMKGGIVIYPSGNTVRLRTNEQIEQRD